jgi:hypothetical protein
MGKTAEVKLLILERVWGHTIHESVYGVSLFQLSESLSSSSLFLGLRTNFISG